ncbi:MAG: hypothetical protein K2P94_13390 [Rhodospirillaceae bacterium]|nr:hypothetical protein [Rhodospirillaceae bacterium]
MSLSSVNSPLSLQESQLVQILQQQAAFRAKAQSAKPEENEAGQNLPAGTNAPAIPQDLDPDLSPQKISALLLALQTQQASLDTTLLLGGSAAGPGGKILADYLTTNSNVSQLGDAANDDGPEDNGGLALVDYLA